MLLTIRHSIVVAFGAFVLFLCAYAALNRTADPIAPFEAVGRVHPEIALAHALIAYSGEIALLALLLGGLPILFIVLKQALPNGPRGVIRLFWLKPRRAAILLGIAFLVTLCFLGLLFVTASFSGMPACTAANGCILGQPLWLSILSIAALIGGITLGIFVILIISTSLSLAVLRSEFGTRLLRFALFPLGVLALAMATSTVAALIWIIRLWVDAPQFAASAAGLGNGQTAWVSAIIAAMAVSSVVAIVAFTSGLRASWMHIAL